MSYDPNDPTLGSVHEESKVEISYYVEPDPVIDMIRPEGTEQISLNELLDLVPQYVLVKAWEQAKENRQRIEAITRPDPFSSYMMDLIEENSRSDADPGL